MSGPALVLSIVDTCTGESHRVPIDVAALHRRSGQYPALCGTEVVTASLTTLPVRECQACVARAAKMDGSADLRRKPVRSVRMRLPWSRGAHHHGNRYA